MSYKSTEINSIMHRRALKIVEASSSSRSRAKINNSNHDILKVEPNESLEAQNDIMENFCGFDNVQKIETDQINSEIKSFSDIPGKIKSYFSYFIIN